MALKRVLDTLDGLPEAHKALYVEKNGKFYLDAEDDDKSELKTALEREREERRKEKERADKLQRERDDAAGQTEAERLEKLRSEGKIKDIEESWKTKLDDSEKKSKEKTKRLTGVIVESMVGGVAKSLATKISTVPSLMSDAIRKRLTVEFDDQDNPSLRVIGADGKATAHTVEDLEKELVANPEYAAIIVANRSSGGGATGQEGSGGAGNKKPADYTEAERVALWKSDPEGFKRIFPEQL